MWRRIFIPHSGNLKVIGYANDPGDIGHLTTYETLMEIIKYDEVIVDTPTLKITRHKAGQINIAWKETK